jgi:hypothetical protein
VFVITQSNSVKLCQFDFRRDFAYRDVSDDRVFGFRHKLLDGGVYFYSAASYRGRI